MTIKNEPTNFIIRLDKRLTAWLNHHPAIARHMAWFGPLENRFKVMKLNLGLLILTGIFVIVAFIVEGG